MKVVFSTRAWIQYTIWLERNPDMVLRINTLIEDARRHPFSGIGRPEPLRGELRGFWSRRIDREHRFVYRVAGREEAQALEIASCRYQYER